MAAKANTVFKEFTSSERNAGLVLLACALLSLCVANSFKSYTDFWHMHLALPGLDLSIEHWINDGLMTIFFLMAGLEIERELYAGELHPFRKAILPVAAAVGGMLVPALIYVAFNYDIATSNGFGIPMGTDIAFALGILSLAGKRVPVSIKILLTAIAIIDDLGSILIIAFFYGSEIQYYYLAGSLGIFGVLVLLNRLKINHLLPYLLLGVPMWYCMMQSGIHPTVSGVLLAFACPFSDGSDRSPSIRLQKALHVPVAFIILPVFTLANTAIPVSAEYLSALWEPHAAGIGLGLVIGKPVGILLIAGLIVRLKIVSLPQGVSWYDVLAMGCIAGIGFTMSVFITQLAFSETYLIRSSKLMILLASAGAALLGLGLFYAKRFFQRSGEKQSLE